VGRYRSHSPDEIEIELVVECCVDRIAGIRQQERITVRGCTHDCLGGDIAARTCPVRDDERLAEPFRQPLTEQARGDVGSPASRKADDDAHGPRRIGLPEGKARDGRQRGSARCQMQKISAEKFI
jgi:hypothetical protein